MSHNAKLMAEHRRIMPGGLTSTNRRVDRDLVFTAARGAIVVDADGREYIDYNCAFGATILGHCHPAVAAAVVSSLRDVDLIGLASTKAEGELGASLLHHWPFAERLLFCNSGSEATYHALRIARAVTGRQQIIKFQGCYHGWHDAVAMNVASAESRIGTRDPLSTGSLRTTLKQTIVLPFNDVDAVAAVLACSARQIAAIILEPIQHNVGCIPATRAFLEGLRELCTRHGVMLIFDEVITGFRHAIGGCQATWGITADVSTWGKAMGNGLPIAAVCGSAELIDRCRPAPDGDVFLAGTYNGCPMAMSGALAVIRELERPDFYRDLYSLGEELREGLLEILARRRIRARVAGHGSIWVVYFLDHDVKRYEDLLDHDTRFDVAFRSALADRGVLSSSVPLKRYNFTGSHTREHVAQTLAAADEALQALVGNRGMPRRTASPGIIEDIR